MSNTITENLIRLSTAKDDIATAISAYGGTVGQYDGFEEFPEDITNRFKYVNDTLEVLLKRQTDWDLFRAKVRNGSAESEYPVGTLLYDDWGNTSSTALQILAYDVQDLMDTTLTNMGYIHNVVLCEYKITYQRTFDAAEAWLYVEQSIPAGTYRFTIPNWDATYGGNKTYIFTSTTSVPISGQLTLSWPYQQNPVSVSGYSSNTSTTALFTATVSEWDGTTSCIDLGTIKLNMSDPDSTYGKLNHIHRARYGSNNYWQSGLRQWLNSTSDANIWWTPQTIFDRPYSNADTDGRLKLFNSNFTSVLSTPTVRCITNNIFETPSLDGTTFSLQTSYTVTDKIFLLTHTNVGFTDIPTVDTKLSFYNNATDSDRIKYLKSNNNAQHWWLRVPNPSLASSFRVVYSSGALVSINATNTLGVVAPCTIQ